MQRPSSNIPLLTGRTALFLDFDGTLVDLAGTPDSVVVGPRLVPLLSDLSKLLDGALAIVTGREIASIDYYLAPLKLPLGAEHGSQWRLASGLVESIAPPDIRVAVETAEALNAKYPELILERKYTSISLHYRLAPELESMCIEAMDHAAIGVPNVTVMRGKAVVEVKSSLTDKGHVIERLMNTPPFIGRVPVFAGDDLTDESAIDKVQTLGGIAVKVGQSPSSAQHRCATPEALIEWLAESLTALKAAGLDSSENKEQKSRSAA